MKKYKFITIRQVEGELFEAHPVYRVFNNRTGNQLAVLSWYKPWKQYVFSSREECANKRPDIDYRGRIINMDIETEYDHIYHS